jgi:hypothetical protein
MRRPVVSLSLGLFLGIAAWHGASAQVPPPVEPPPVQVPPVEPPPVQPPPVQPPSVQPPPVCTAPATDPTAAPVPAPAVQGWLILHGQLIPGPYTVTVANDSVAVNGYLFSQPAASSTGTLDTGSHAATFQQFWSLWPEWCAGGDLAGATQQAVAWWQAAPGVASAVLVAGGSADLQVQFTDSPDSETVSLQLPDDPQSPDQVRAQTLSDLAEEVADDLAYGRLLIVEDEGHTFSPAAGESADLLAQIEQIAALPTVDARTQALLAILPDAQMASSIAQSFNTVPTPIPSPTQEASHDLH